MHNPDLRNYFTGKRVLITGGFGFIGSNLVRRLVNLNAKVDVVDSLAPETGSNPYNLADIINRISFTNADIRDAAKMKPLLRRKDFLFNLAGQSSHIGGMQTPIQDLEVNALAQLQLLETCREVNPEIQIVFAGTRQVYGRAGQLPVNEVAAVDPVDFNGVSKLAGELYHILSHRIYGLRTSSLRMINTYGPRMRVKDARQNFIGLWIKLILDGKKIPVFGTGQQIRDLNYVEDVVDAFLACAINPAAKGKIYNLGATPIKLVDLANLLITINGSGSYSVKPFPTELLAIDIRDYTGDYSKIRDELGWQPQTRLGDGIRKTLAYYHSNKEHYW
jgi:UDP-glucose 4-epimerase